MRSCPEVQRKLTSAHLKRVSSDHRDLVHRQGRQRRAECAAVGLPVIDGDPVQPTTAYGHRHHALGVAYKPLANLSAVMLLVAPGSTALLVLKYTA